jgi:hypothetical protein
MWTKRVEVKREQRKLLNKEVYSLYSSTQDVRIIFHFAQSSSKKHLHFENLLCIWCLFHWDLYELNCHRNAFVRLYPQHLGLYVCISSN